MLRRLSNTWPVNTMTSSKKQAGDAAQPHLTLISTPENPHVNADLDPEIQNEPGSADPVSPTLDSISPTERKGFEDQIAALPGKAPIKKDGKGQ